MAHTLNFVSIKRITRLANGENLAVRRSFFVCARVYWRKLFENGQKLLILKSRLCGRVPRAVYNQGS